MMGVKDWGVEDSEEKTGVWAEDKDVDKVVSKSSKVILLPSAKYKVSSRNMGIYESPGVYANVRPTQAPNAVSPNVERALQNLERCAHIEYREMHYLEGLQDPNEVPLGLCSEHREYREMQYLEELHRNGLMRCKRESMCQNAGSEASGTRIEL
jgi:hypothetical protein